MVSKADPEKLVSFIVKSIIGDSKRFTIQKTDDDNLITLEIKLAKEDIGKIIGKAGTTIWAIRRLAAIAGAAIGKKVQVTLLE